MTARPSTGTNPGVGPTVGAAGSERRPADAADVARIAVHAASLVPASPSSARRRSAWTNGPSDSTCT
ncbi:hypothetical protein NKG94_09950 [Micromonospora sp. M12]